MLGRKDRESEWRKGYPFGLENLIKVKYSLLTLNQAVLNAFSSGDGVKGHVWSKQDKASAWVVALLLQLHGVNYNVYVNSLSGCQDGMEVPDRIMQVNFLCSGCGVMSLNGASSRGLPTSTLVTCLW